MTAISTEKIKDGSTYLYYQKSGGGDKWVAFVKVISQTCEIIELSDVCDYHFTFDHTVYRNPPQRFSVSGRTDYEGRGFIQFFELTEDEIRNHIVLENI